MSITKERRLLRMIHQHARIEKSCSECMHEGDYMSCAFCDQKKKNCWEWRFEDRFNELMSQPEYGGDKKCPHRKSRKKSIVKRRSSPP